MREHFLRSKLHQLISSRFEARFNCIMVKGGISLHHLLNQPLAHVFWIASCFKATIATLRQLLQNWGNYCKIEAAIATLRQLFSYWGNYCHIEATLATSRQQPSLQLMRKKLRASFVCSCIILKRIGMSAVSFPFYLYLFYTILLISQWKKATAS